MSWQVDFDQLRRGYRSAQFRELNSRVQAARFAMNNGNLLAHEEQENVVKALELAVECLRMVFYPEMMAQIDRAAPVAVAKGEE